MSLHGPNNTSYPYLALLHMAGFLIASWLELSSLPRIRTLERLLGLADVASTRGSALGCVRCGIGWRGVPCTTRSFGLLGRLTGRPSTSFAANGVSGSCGVERMRNIAHKRRKETKTEEK